MVNVIGVRFQNAGKLYYFDPGAFWPTPGDYVVVETSRGIEFGEVVTGVREMSDELLTSPLKQVVRIATAEDVKHAEENKRREKEAYQVCQKKIGEHKLDMKLVSVEYTFDNSKILFYFTANGRVDFRSLVKDLASVFKTRIELRQIGVRDEAKMLGGLGPCGRQICCGAFLGDFQPVSIKMAKEQNLSLNPTKISGVCGRLMCCLKYEQETYEKTRKKMPKIGKEVITPEGNGVVWDLNVIKETVRVRIQKGDSSELKDFPMDEVQRPGQPPVQREEAPVAEAPVKEEDAAVNDQPEEAKTEEAPKQEQPRRRERPAKGERRGKQGEQQEKGEKPEKSDKSEKGEKPARQPKPVQRENKRRERPERGEKPQQEKPAKQDKPQQPEAKVEPKQEAKPVEAAKPVVSPWQQAVEAALRAARGEGTGNE